LAGFIVLWGWLISAITLDAPNTEHNARFHLNKASVCGFSQVYCDSPIRRTMSV
jgi:hypothetical protein